MSFLPYKMALGTWQDYTQEEQDWLNQYKQTGNRWHSEWPGIPRLTINKKHRINRLKCLGNSVVPQIPMLLWLIIAQVFIDSGRREEINA
jgi:hypothetical protein